MQENSLQLKDGRELGYSEYGSPQGKPVLFFHGQPGNRLFHPTVAEGIRLISVERPGYGLSDFQLRRCLLDWPQDVCEFAAALGVDKFAVAGFSGGGPYALACAHQIPDLLSAAIIISSPAPLTVSEIRRNSSTLVKLNTWLSQKAPGLMQTLFRTYWKDARKHPEKFIEMASRQSCIADQEVLRRPEIYAMLLDSWRENLRVDSEGYVLDAQILTGDWGFALGQIRCKVHLWQGEADKNVPLSCGQYLAKTIPGCQANFVPGEGHFLLFSHWQDILAKAL